MCCIAYPLEVRIPAFGHLPIMTTGKDACSCPYHSELVGNSEATEAALMAWAPFSPRLASVHLKGATLNLVVSYACSPAITPFGFAGRIIIMH